MDLEQAFLADIVEHPADRTPRLIYADWLEEQHGDDVARMDRARFIRAQCAAETTSPGDGAHLPACIEAARLLGRNQFAWTRPLVSLGRNWRFAGGFIEHLVGGPGLLMEQGQRLLALAPVRSFSVRRVAGSWSRFLSCPHLRRLENLEVKMTFHDGAKWIDPLVACEHLGNLRCLSLDRNPLTDRTAELLASSSAFPRLTELELGGSVVPSQRFLAILDQSGLGRRLTALRFSTGWGNEFALQGLLEGEWPSLRHLHLRGMHAQPEIVRWVLAAPWMSRIESLTFSGSRFDPGSLRELHEAPTLGENLRELRLEGCSFSRDHQPEPPLDRWPNLQALCYGHDRGDLIVDALRKRPLPANLHAVQIAGLDLRDDRLTPVLDALDGLKLRSLDLVRVGLRTEEVRRLIASPGFRSVQELDLSANLFSTSVVATLLEAPETRGLLALRVRGCSRLAPVDIRRLAARFYPNEIA